MSTIQIISTASVTVTHTDGTATRNGNVIENSLNGDAFSWEVPDNLAITIDYSDPVTISFDDKDGVLSDDPANSDATVTDQRLSEAVTIDGTTYTPSDSTYRWNQNPPVYVEEEYKVTLYDADGKMYTLVGISITTGYSTKVVGITFEGDVPAAGTTLYYIQGKSTYTANPSSQIDQLAICFLPGTLIDTPEGRRPIETLREGDLVMTLDHGARPIRWIGSSRVAGDGDLAPIRIAAGRLGNDRPLLVSPNHRMLVSGPAVSLHFGTEEVLLAARFLLDGTTVTRAPQPRVTYFHILLDAHELLLAEGAPAESLHLGGEAIRALGSDARDEIARIFPDFADNRQSLSRPSLTRHEALLLAA